MSSINDTSYIIVITLCQIRLMIRIMNMLCTGSDCIAKGNNLSLTMARRTTNVLFYLFIYLRMHIYINVSNHYVCLGLMSTYIK